MRVVAFGSRSYTDSDLIEATLTGLYLVGTVGYLTVDTWGFTVIEGGAPGADTFIGRWAEQSPLHPPPGHPDPDLPPFTHVRMDADWDGPCRPTCRPGHRKPRRHAGGTYCPAAGQYRNAAMRDRLLDGDRHEPRLGVGFVDKPLKQSPGSNGMASLLEAAGVTTHVLERKGGRR